MSDPNALDESALGPWLEEHVKGFRSLERVEKFGQGQSNPTYGLRAASGRYVLRAKPPGKLLPSAHQVDREFRVMQALADTPVPVPRMLALAENDASPIGRTFFVMEHVPGRVLWDPALPDETPETRAAIYDSMNRALAALHDVDPKAVGLEGFGKPGNYFERQTGRWADQYRKSEVERHQPTHELIAWLEREMPPDDGASCIVHGDYRIDNMMFAVPGEGQDGTDILALLDWELSTLGHPFADLAYQVMQWQLPNEGDMRGLLGIDRARAGLPSDDEYVARYCERRGIERPDNWSFYIAFCFFRIAAILQGVYKRSLDGNASNPERARKMGAAVPLLTQMGLAAANS